MLILFELKIKNILFSQNPPIDFEKTPYAELAKKYNIKIDFFKFFQIQGINIAQFKKNKFSLTDFTSIIFTSKNAIDHFFAILKELKAELSFEVKFCCINQSTALYLQKYITYRKRKMFYANGTVKELVKILENNIEEKYLLPCSIDSCVNPLLSLLDEKKINYQKAEVFQIVMANLHQINIENYDMIVFFSPFGIQSLKTNYPDYQQGETIIGALGHQVLETAEAEGIRIDVMAPTPEHPSIFTAIDQYLQKITGRKR
jgi:uroporphyrinogen-III synthase